MMYDDPPPTHTTGKKDKMATLNDNIGKIETMLSERGNELLIHDQVPPDKKSISEILNFKPSHLVSLPKKDLYICLVALCQYSIYLNAQINYTNTKYFLCKKKFDIKLITKMIEEKPSGKSEAEKKRKIVDKYLHKLELTLIKYEAELKMISNIDKPILELINVIKKILGESGGPRKEY